MEDAFLFEERQLVSIIIECGERRAQLLRILSKGEKSIYMNSIPNVVLMEIGIEMENAKGISFLM